MRSARRIGCLSLILSLLAWSGTAVAARWHGLRSVRVTVSNPSLPPPDGKARTRAFVTPTERRRAQRALNSNHIRRLAKARVDTSGCTGGYNVVITVVKHDSTRVRMGAYRCGKTYGHIGGNLPGFLKALGISPP